MKKHLRITVNGTIYDVVAEILDEGTVAPNAAVPGSTLIAGAAAAAMPPPPLRSTLAGAAVGEVRSPLAAKLVSIDAAVGTPVVAGQTLITLEAMKMNHLISATAAGKVAAVHARPGDSVEEGQLLMSLA